MDAGDCPAEDVWYAENALLGYGDRLFGSPPVMLVGMDTKDEVGCTCSIGLMMVSGPT